MADENIKDAVAEEEVKPSPEAGAEPFSTIFSDPQEHKDKKPVTRKKVWVRVIAAVLCLALAAAGTFAVLKLVPEKEKGSEDFFEAETYVLGASANFESITINNRFGTMKLVPVASETKTDSDISWTLEGYDPALIDQTSLQQIVSYAESVSVLKTFTDRDADYGFDDPLLTVSVKCKEGTGTDFTMTAGKPSGDSAGYYISLTDVDEIYLVLSNSVLGFNVAPLDLAISSGIPAVKKNNRNKDCFEDEELVKFTSLTIESKAFSAPLVIKPNDNERFNSMITYIVTSPEYRIADNIDPVFNLFKSGLTVYSCASFDTSAAELHKFGLDDPDIKITGDFAGEKYVYNFKKADAGYYYCYAPHDVLIRRISENSIESLLTSDMTSFYQKFMVLESISDLSSFSIKGMDVDCKFDISYDEDNEMYTILKNGEKIDAENFKTFYSNFISTSAVDFSISQMSAADDLKIVLEHKDGSKATTLNFKKSSEQRYQYYVDGSPMGQVTSSALKLIVKQANEVK